MNYQKYLAGRVVPEEESAAKGKKPPPKKGAAPVEAEPEPKPKIIHGDPKYRLIAIDGVHSIDFQFMIIYETMEPKKWQKIYRSKLNPRVKSMNQSISNATSKGTE